MVFDIYSCVLIEIIYRIFFKNMMFSHLNVYIFGKKNFQIKSIRVVQNTIQNTQKFYYY